MLKATLVPGAAAEWLARRATAAPPRTPNRRRRRRRPPRLPRRPAARRAARSRSAPASIRPEATRRARRRKTLGSAFGRRLGPTPATDPATDPARVPLERDRNRETGSAAPVTTCFARPYAFAAVTSVRAARERIPRRETRNGRTTDARVDVEGGRVRPGRPGARARGQDARGGARQGRRALAGMANKKEELRRVPAPTAPQEPARRLAARPGACHQGPLAPKKRS